MSDYRNTLHIYGQDAWHDDACIVGDREALEALRRAIDTALAAPRAALDSFVNDGEGYELTVLLLEADDPLWPRMAVPYSDEIAQEQPEHAVWPDVLGEKRKRGEA